MQQLLEFIARHFHWLLFIVLEAVSVALLFSYNSYQGSAWVSSANAVSGRIYEFQADIEQFLGQRENNELLTRRNIFLEHKVKKLEQLLADQHTDTAALRQQIASQYTTVAAKVVSNSVNRTENLITIDKGEADGIRPDMGVVGGTGIVGVVYLTGKHYSVVIPVLNRRSHISCAIRHRQYFGYLSWQGGDPTIAYVDDIPRHARFRRGDFVETSGYSSIFPRGITVGRIEEIYNSRDGLSYRLKVKLSTDFSRLRDVCVVTDTEAIERQRLLDAARDSLTLTNR